jgi:hypothetical protein
MGVNRSVIEYRVPLPGEKDVAVDLWVERLAAEEGVTARAMGPLKTIPGSRHWHLGGERGSGIVEITLDPGRRCLVVAVHENRRGCWAGGAAARMAATLRRLTDET